MLKLKILNWFVEQHFSIPLIKDVVNRCMTPKNPYVQSLSKIHPRDSEIHFYRHYCIKLKFVLVWGFTQVRRFHSYKKSVSC